MAHRAIREADAKKLLSRSLKAQGFFKEGLHAVGVDSTTDLEALPRNHPWLATGTLVVKPDCLFGKRGKLNLLKLDVPWTEVKKFLKSVRNKQVELNGLTGVLDHWVIQPFIPHQEEFYFSVRALHEEDVLMFSAKGGIDIEANKESVKVYKVKVGTDLTLELIERHLLSEISNKENRRKVANFMLHVYRFFGDFGVVFLEMNPFTLTQAKTVRPLDLRVVLDDTASFEQEKNWGKNFAFPEAFGTTKTREERVVSDLDARTGASLKLKILRPAARVWTMVAGGGASVIYADTISDLGYASELANYGEYSGDPNREMTREYARVLLSAMTAAPDEKGRGKVLLIGGGVANFTDVAKTFEGIIDAIREFEDQLKAVDTKIYVRRGGPNYKEGLRRMRELGEELNLPIEVYGPETHMTYIVRRALEK